MSCCLEDLTSDQEVLLAAHEASTGFETELAPVRQSPAPVDNSGMTMIISIVVIVLVHAGLAGGLFAYQKMQKDKKAAEEARQHAEQERKEHEEHEKKLEAAMGQVKEYITSMHGQGFTDDQIKQALSEQGWDDADIGHFFN